MRIVTPGRTGQVVRSIGCMVGYLASIFACITAPTLLEAVLMLGLAVAFGLAYSLEPWRR